MELLLLLLLLLHKIQTTKIMEKNPSQPTVDDTINKPQIATKSRDQLS